MRITAGVASHHYLITRLMDMLIALTCDLHWFHPFPVRTRSNPDCRFGCAASVDGPLVLE